MTSLYTRQSKCLWNPVRKCESPVFVSTVAEKIVLRFYLFYGGTLEIQKYILVLTKIHVFRYIQVMKWTSINLDRENKN